MVTYLIRRVLNFIPTFVLMSFMVFLILEIAPGDPLTRYEQALMVTYNYSLDAAEARTDQLRSLYGLDRNFVLRFFTWLANFMRGEFGVSFNNFRPVSDLIGQRLLYSLAISSSALIFMYMVGVPVGLWTAYRQYGVSDYAVSVVAFIGLSIPNFFLALLVLVGLLFFFDIPPPQRLFSPEYVDAPWSLGKLLDAGRGLILPVLVIGTEGLAKTCASRAPTCSTGCRTSTCARHAPRDWRSRRWCSSTPSGWR